MHVVTPPTVATPGEVQERFMYVCTEAVNLATLFHKAKWKCESVLYGQSCKDLSATFHSTLDETRGDSPTPPSLDSDKIFCRGLLHYLLDAVSVGVVSVCTAYLQL